MFNSTKRVIAPADVEPESRQTGGGLEPRPLALAYWLRFNARHTGGMIVTPAEYADQIRRVIRNELDDAERAIKNDNPGKARRELDDAVTKLKRIANGLASLRSGSS